MHSNIVCKIQAFHEEFMHFMWNSSISSRIQAFYAGEIEDENARTGNGKKEYFRPIHNQDHTEVNCSYMGILSLVF